VHPAYTGQEGLPFFDMIDDISQIDLLLVTHFHLDHVGSLPYFLEKTSFQGRVFMTHPTKAVYKMLMRRVATLVFCLLSHLSL
jgi:cleavage and polyadenylation specificity factor subunit 3